MAHLIKYDEEHKVSIYMADKCDYNGNSRVIVHFLDFLGREEREKHDILELWDIVAKRLKVAAGENSTIKNLAVDSSDNTGLWATA